MTLDAGNFEYVCRLVREQSGIALDEGKEYLVENRLTPVAVQAGFASLQDFVHQLRLYPFNELHIQTVEALTTSETRFFRDDYPFDALRSVILPELIRKRIGEQRLNLWSAASSSGQEAYSVAMVLAEHFPSLLNWNLALIASDISRQALERARRGRYSQVEVNRGLPPSFLLKYFQPQGSDWQIAEPLRRRIDFRPINLIEAWPALPPMDLILMRNVLIYFNVETKKSILAKVRRLLKPDGYLLLGSAETTINLDDAFRVVQVDKAVYYQLRP